MQKTKVKSPKTGWELHQLMGNDPSLRWFIDAHLAIESKGIVTSEMKTVARRWILEHSPLSPRLDDLRVPGVHPQTIRNTIRHHTDQVFCIFKDYGIVDSEKMLDEYIAEESTIERITRQNTRTANNDPPF